MTAQWQLRPYIRSTERAGTPLAVRTGNELSATGRSNGDGSIGFSNALPAGLALYARLSPPAMAATMMGVFYLQFFIASNLAGFLGGYLEKMPGSQFWGMHAAMTGFAGMIVLVVRRGFGHMAESHAR